MKDYLAVISLLVSFLTVVMATGIYANGNIVLGYTLFTTALLVAIQSDFLRDGTYD